MKKIVSAFLAMALIICMIPSAFAASDEAIEAADALYELGLFNGTGTDANGKPIYDLDSTPTRNQAVTMLVRLLGKEAAAVNGNWSTPFTDVAEWAKPYVGYAYSTGLTNGTSNTTFSGDDAVSTTQYITFVLRALGYESGVDFQWDKAWELSDIIGLTNGQYKNAGTFTRGDVAIISYNALGQKSRNANVTLIQKLQNCSAVSSNQTLTGLLGKYGGIDYYSEYPVLPKVENIDLNATQNKRQPLAGATYFIFEYHFVAKSEAFSTCELYCAFLKNQGFSVVQNTNSEYISKYTVTVPSTGKSFNLCVGRIADEQPWYLDISIPIEDVVLNENSYDTYFTLSDSNMTVDRLGTATLTATVQSTSPIRIEWESFDDTIVMIGQTSTSVNNGCTRVSVQIGGVQSGSTFVSATLYVNGEMYDMAMCWVEVPVDMQKSPVKIANITSKTNSVGGTTWTFDVTNNGAKSIKYVSVYWRCYNAVGDILYDTISHSDRFSCRITGPIEPGATLSRIQNTRPFYNYDFANTIGFIEIVIDYMDGTVEVVNPTNYYDYWDLD